MLKRYTNSLGKLKNVHMLEKFQNKSPETKRFWIKNVTFPDAFFNLPEKVQRFKKFSILVVFVEKWLFFLQKN